MVTFILTFVSSQSVIHCGAGSACNQFSFGSDPDKISCGIRLKATWGTLEGALAFSRTRPVYTARHLHIIYCNIATGTFEGPLKYKL